MKGELDDIDAGLVRELGQDGRMSNRELASRLGIAESTCLARTRALVERGVIRSFRAVVDPGMAGFPLQALVSVSIRAGARRALTSFYEEIRQRPEVQQVFFLGGAEDFIVHIAARDSAHVRDFVVENLSARPDVASTRTSMVFEHHLGVLAPLRRGETRP